MSDELKRIETPTEKLSRATQLRNEVNEARQNDLNDYFIPLSPGEREVIQSYLTTANTPEEAEDMRYSVASAIQYSKWLDIPLDEAYNNLEALNTQYIGGSDTKTPKSNFIAVTDNFKIGMLQNERNKIGIQLMEAENNGYGTVKELRNQLSEIDSKISSYSDEQSRSLPIEAFKAASLSLPFTAKGIMAQAAGSILLGPIGGIVAGTLTSYESMVGEEYLNLTEDGHDPQLSKNIAMVSALFQGMVESIDGLQPAYAATFGASKAANTGMKAIYNNITKSFFQKVYTSGTLGKIASTVGSAAGGYIWNAIGEGNEEVIQGLIGDLAKSLATAVDEYAESNNIVDATGAAWDKMKSLEVASEALENFRGGVLGALVLGAPNMYFDGKATVEDFAEVGRKAETVESKEAFIKETSDSPIYEGMSEEAKLKAQEEVYDKFEPQRNKKAEERKAMELDRAEVMDTSDNVEETITDESGRVVRDEEYRNEEGGLNYEEKLYDTNEDGSTENLFIVKGKGNQEYGRIMYREDTDGNVTINDFKMSATRENLRQEVYTDFAEKMAGKNIEWETRGKTAASVRDLLAENNIRGKNNGLNYFADKNEVQNQKTRMSWDRQIREAIPSMDAEQRSTGIALVESFAKKHGQSIADYDMEIFNGKLFIDKASKEAYESALNQGMNPENIGGYVDIDELGKSTKGIIYAAKKGDATTFVHENAHIFRRLLTADEMAQAEKLFNVEDHNWTRQNEEDFAYALQGYAFEGKAVGEAKALFDKLAQALVRVINSLKDKIDFSPELSDFIEGLFADPTTALAQAKRAVEQNERASYKQDTKEETTTSEDIIADGTMDTSDRVSEAIDTAGDMLYQYIDVAGAMNLDNRTKNMYDRAEAMREAGESLENIRLLTGYSIGPDGVFQYELDDSENEIIDREGVQKAINAAQYMNRAMTNPATNAQNLELLQYAMDKQLELMNATYDTVGKLYKAGELYTAKPELKNIRVGYVYDNRRIRAVQFEGGIGINLAYVSSNEELKGALVHELQHVIDLKASNINYDGDFWTGLYNAMESVEQNNKEYYADLVDDGGIVQYFLTDPYERNAHSAQRRLNLSKAERRAYKPTDVVNNNYLFQSKVDEYINSLSKEDTAAYNTKKLVKAEPIKNFIENTLINWGFEVNGKGSNLSDSMYVSFTDNDGDTKEIRVSNHDLPVTYDLMYKPDYDVIVGEERNGTNGDAQSYEDLVIELSDKYGKELPNSIKNLQRKKEIEEEIKSIRFSELEENATDFRDFLGSIDYEKSTEVIKNNYPQYYEEIAGYIDNMENASGKERQKLRKSRNEAIRSIVERIESENKSIFFQSQEDDVRAQYECTDQWMKAPNGRDTNLTEKQWLQVRTPNFKAWFGDWESDLQNASKVVDENGEPLVMYHGTRNADFDVFNTLKDSDNKDNVGSHFGPKKTAEDFSKDNIYEVFLDIKKPFFPEFDFFADNFNNAYLDTLLYMKKIMKSEGAQEAFNKIYEVYPVLNDYKEEISKGYMSQYFDDDEVIENKELDKETYWNTFQKHRNEMVDIMKEMMTIEGYDGMRYNNWYEGDFDNECFVVFEPNQIKSATDNNGDFSSDNPSILFQDKEYLEAVNSGDFDKAQEMVDEKAKLAGYTTAANHGTLTEFTIFDRSKGNIEGDMGAGFYFTDNESDVEENYANEEGPDLNNKIDRLAEQLQQDEEGISEEELNGRDFYELEYEDFKDIARKRMELGEPKTINAYLKIENPVIVGENSSKDWAYETTFTYEESYDEENDEYGEPEGTLVDFIEELKNVASDYGDTEDIDYYSLYELGLDGEVNASDLIKSSKELLQYAMDYDTGDLAGNEIVRQTFENLGYDAIVDHTVGEKFKRMKGIDYDTTHYIVFKPEQIKKSDPVTYNENGNVIPLSERFNESNPSILFQTVYHGSPYVIRRQGGQEIRGEQLGFDHSKMGTGEGAQAYGWGTYVTQVEGIAESYASIRKPDYFAAAEEMVDRIGFDNAADIEYAIKLFSDMINFSYNGLLSKREFYKSKSENMFRKLSKEKSLSVIDYIINNVDEINKTRSNQNIYTLDIPDDGPSYIQWDKEVPDELKKDILNYSSESFGKELSESFPQAWTYERAKEYFIAKSSYEILHLENGKEAYKYLSKNIFKKKKEVSEFLSSLGYVGISYPADNLRGGRKDGARNFVIFNEEDIKVTDWHAKDAQGNQLFQYMQMELDDDTLREASQFDTWEEWYEFAKAMDTDGIVTGEWDNVAEQEWFKSAWESSQKIYNPEQNVDPEDEARKDRDFIELIKKPGYLEDFLDRAKYFINSELEQPADESEAKEFEKLNESKRFAANVMTDPVHYANDLDDTQKKKLLSMIEGSPREYRAIYAEVFNDSTLSVPEGYEYTVDTSTAPEDMQMELDNMTPAQRREAMKAIEDEAIRSQIESGSLPMDETLDRYVKVVNEENRKLKKEIDRLNKEYSEDLKNISNAQKKALLEEYNRLQDLAADLQNRNLKGNSRISSGLSAGAMATSNVVDASDNGTYNTVMDRIASLKKMFAGERDASALVAKADERAKQKVLQNKKKAEAEALKEMKKLRTNAIKRMVRKVSFNNVNYDEAKKIIAIQDFIDHWVRTGVNLWLGETEVTASEIYQKFATDSDYRDEVKKALLDKKAGERGLRVLRNLNEAMLDDEGRTFNQWTTKEKNDLIEVLGMNDQVIRLNLDSLATGRKQAIHNFLDKDGRITEECMQTVYSALPKDVIARIRYVPMKKWTLEQAEELAKIIDGIYEEGKLVKAGREQLRRDRYEEIRKRIQDTVKDTGITFDPNDTPEDIKKKREKIDKILGLRTQAKGTSASASEKKSMREKFMAADRGTGNVRRFSRVMDNWSEGVFTDTLCFREYMAYDEEMKAINERSRHVQKYMADNGITMDKLMEQHTFHGLMDGENITLTTDELLYVYIASQDDLSKEAVMYGNFTTEEEKESVKQHEAKYADKEAIKWFKRNAASRFNKVLARATNLVEQNKDLAGLVEKIENDYEKQYERLNRVSIDVFNMPVNRVESYVPIYRLSQSGDTNEQQIAKDILANYSGAPSNYVNRGMTKNRIEIGPTNQTKVQMGLFKTWAESMQKTEHFIAYGELVRDLNAIYTSKAASATCEAIAKRYGDDANNYIKEYINELANPNKGQAKSSLDTLVHVMRGQTAPAYLAWKTSGIIKQLCTSPWPFMAYVTPAEYLVSVGEFITDWNKMNDFVKNRSVFMANRTIDPIIDLIKEAQNKADNKTKAALANFNKMGMQGLEMADWVSVAPGWYAAYKQKYAEIEKAQKSMDPMKDGYKNSEAIETEAIAYADDVVRLTQPSGRSADIAPLFKNSAEIAKVLLQFQTSLNVIYQNIRFDLPYQIKNKQWKQAVGAVIGYTAAGILVNAVVSGGFVTGDGSDDEPEDKLKRAVFYATTQFTDSVPVVGQTLTNTVQKLLTGEGQYSNSTLFPVVDTLTKTVSDISKDNYGKAASDFGQGVAYTLGLPVSGTKELLRMFGIGDNEDGIDFKPEALWGRR